MAQIQTHRFKSGLRLVLVPMAGVKTVTALVSVGVGSRYETAEQAGISHFVEHMAFKGTKKRPSARVIARELDGLGSESNAHTGYESTGFYIKMASSKLAQALDILGDITTNSIFPEPEIERERGVILEELNMYEDLPMRKVDDVYSELMYRGGGMARPIIGFRETVKQVTQSDMLRHVKAWFGAENVVVVIAGDKKTIGGEAAEGVKQLVEASFRGMKEFEVGEKTRDEAELNGLRVRVEKKRLEQSHLMMGVRGLPLGHKDRYVISLLAVILGGNMSSRLFEEIREKRGWAYYIGAGVNSHIGEGDFAVRAGLVKQHTLEAIALIWRQLQMSRRVSQEEVDRSKEFVKGKLYMGLENSHGLAELQADNWLLEGKVREVKEIVRGIEKVTREDVERVSRQIFRRDRLVVAVVGNSVKKAEIDEILSVHNSDC